MELSEAKSDQYFQFFRGEYMALGYGQLFKRKPDDRGTRARDPNAISFHSGISKGVRIVEGIGGKLQAAVVLDCG